MHFAELPLQAIEAVALDTFPFPIPLRRRAQIPAVFAPSGIFDLFYYHAFSSQKCLRTMDGYCHDGGFLGLPYEVFDSFRQPHVSRCRQVLSLCKDDC